MKVLIVIPSLHRGGAERVVSLLSQEWAKSHDVKIAVFDVSAPAYVYSGELVDLELPANTSLLGKCVQALLRVLALARLFVTNKPDKIVSFMESANFPCTLAALLTGKRSRLWVSVRDDPQRFSMVHRKLIPLLYHLPGKVVAVSEGIAQALRLMGVPNKKLISIPNPAPSQAPALSTTLSTPTCAPERYILGVGRLHQQKGFDRLVETLAYVDDPRLHLVLLGEGKERQALAKLAKALNVAGQVHMLGAVNNLWPWYRHAQCFVLSSRHEGWPNVIMEAMTQGVPVVAFDCKYGPREMIRNNVNGMLIAEGDTHGMAHAIQEIVTKTHLRQRLTAKASSMLSKYSGQYISMCWLEGISKFPHDR